MSLRRRLSLSCVSIAVLCATGTARGAVAEEQGAAQATASVSATSPPPQGPTAVQEVIVTAQKREQSVNSVGMSITAATGAQMTQLGIVNTSDLTKIVPGLTFAQTPSGPPVYTLRGVGFYETSLAATPAVSVYVDEVPLPYPAMTEAAGLDLARVEVLKGPQGTLYGQNSTGGAINYISAKPTKTFQAGFDATYGRFDTADVQGFVSGPLTDQLSGRLALRTLQGSDWQKSYTTGATLGARNETEGRLLLDWRPTDRLKFELNLNGWVNDSDTQAAQLLAIHPAAPANEQPAEAHYPLAPPNARAADWDANQIWREHNTFYQAALRATYELPDNLTLTSITAYESYRENEPQDADGTSLEISDLYGTGAIDSESQELRLSEDTEKLHALIGASFEHDKIFETSAVHDADSSDALDFGGYILDRTANFSDQGVYTYAAFANVEYNVLSTLSLEGGIRYNVSDRSFSGCTYSTNAESAAAWTTLESELKGGVAAPPILPFQCQTFNAQFDPVLATGNLNQDNVSWRLGLNWKPVEDTLLYANVSKGYKSGSFPTASAANVVQYAPVTQESLLAYETGFKIGAFRRMVQVNGSLFYYQYDNKQLRSKVLDFVFGPLDALVNVPKSNVKGAELSIDVTPVKGLLFNAAATYLDSDITKFIGYNEAGILANYAGSPFPFSPKYQVTSGLQYTWDLNDRLSAFAGGNLEFHSKTTAGLGSDPLFVIDAYALLDLRAGVQSQDGAWRVELWGKNVTNQYYWNNIAQRVDSIVRYAAMPATYGATLTYRFK
jgi:iron complex outermembrane receptor protein